MHTSLVLKKTHSLLFFQYQFQPKRIFQLLMLLLLPKIVVWQRITANDPARAWLKRWDPLFLKGLYYTDPTRWRAMGDSSAPPLASLMRVRGREGRRRERAREEREKTQRETKPAVSRGFLSPPGTISGHFSHVLMTGNQPSTIF